MPYRLVRGNPSVCSPVWFYMMGRRSSGFVMHSKLVIRVGSGKYYRKLNKVNETTLETVKDNKLTHKRKFASKLNLGLRLGFGKALVRRFRDSYVSMLKTASNLTITGHGVKQSGIADMQKQYVEVLKIAMARGGPDFLLKLQG